jgi:hypothetical protein
MRWFLLLLVSGCAPDDLDYDGVAGDADCAPEDPRIYPGAPDVPGDGIDSDCDGEDAPLPYIGEWRVTDLQAAYSTFSAILPGSTVGDLVIAPDGATTLTATADLDPDLVGAALPIALDFSGLASRTPEDGRVALYLNGTLDAFVLQESSFSDLLCGVEPNALSCDGTLKALDTTLEVFVELTRL